MWHMQKSLIELLLLCTLAVHAEPSRAILGQGESGSFMYDRQDDLGAKVQQLYVRVPRANTNTTFTAVAYVVLRRLGGDQAGPFALPHQKVDAIRGTIWFEEPENLRYAVRSHHILPIPEGSLWGPDLMLETSVDANSVRAVYYRQHAGDRFFSSIMRPLSFTFPLPEGAGPCFKIYDAGYASRKFGICLGYHEQLCESLAPSYRYSAESPALWFHIKPIRNCSVSPGPAWQQHVYDTAVRLHYHVSYHIHMGLAGLLHYTNDFMRQLLWQQPILQPFLKSRALRLIHWEFPDWIQQQESEHMYNCGYDYDQAFLTQHLMTALSACGTNLHIISGDIDEYFHTPLGKPWPSPLPCMGFVINGENGTGYVQLVSRDAESSTVPAAEQSRLWLTTPALPYSSLANHPMTKYDRVAKNWIPTRGSKGLSLPAFEIIAYFVHEGLNVRGQRIPQVNESCMHLLHIRNYMATRPQDIVNNFVPWSHWLFAGRPDTLLAQTGQASW